MKHNFVVNGKFKLALGPGSDLDAEMMKKLHGGTVEYLGNTTAILGETFTGGLVITEREQGSQVAEKQKPQVLIIVDGGNIQGISISDPVDVYVIDHDNLKETGSVEEIKNIKNPCQTGELDVDLIHTEIQRQVNRYLAKLVPRSEQ